MVFYTSDEYIQHLHYIIDLLLNNKEYHVHLILRHAEDEYMVYIKEDKCVILTKDSAPPVALAISEGNMTAAFWDYFRSMVGEKSFENPDNKAAAEALGKYIEELNRAVNIRDKAKS